MMPYSQEFLTKTLVQAGYSEKVTTCVVAAKKAFYDTFEVPIKLAGNPDGRTTVEAHIGPMKLYTQVANPDIATTIAYWIFLLRR